MSYRNMQSVTAKYRALRDVYSVGNRQNKITIHRLVEILEENLLYLMLRHQSPKEMQEVKRILLLLLQEFMKFEIYRFHIVRKNWAFLQQQHGEFCVKNIGLHTYKIQLELKN